MIVVEDALRLLTTTAPPSVRGIVLYQYLNPEGESILLIPPSPFSGLFYSVQSISPLWKKKKKNGIINYGVHSESMRVTASSPIYRTN